MEFVTIKSVPIPYSSIEIKAPRTKLKLTKLTQTVGETLALNRKISAHFLFDLFVKK